MSNLTEVDTRFSLTTIRLMYVWVFNREMEDLNFDDALALINENLDVDSLWVMKANAEKIVNTGFQAFTQAIEEGVK